MGCAMWKRVFMRTSKAQISPLICAVWSGPSLSVVSLDTTECIDGEQMPRSDFAYAKDESESMHFVHAVRHILLAWPIYYYENTPIQTYWKFYNQNRKILMFFIFLLKT